MTDDLAKKRRVRGAHKASATKIMTQISELVGSEHPNQAKLACLRLALNEKLEVIKALDTEAIELIQDDGLDADIERADEFKETIFSALLSVDHLLKRLNPTPVTTTASVREPLQGELLRKWTDLITDLTQSEPITIDRQYFPKHTQMDCYQLFGYCDASAIAYAAVIYLVETTSSGKHSSFVVAKTRVSPLKSQTIPRLELLSALLLARLMKNVTESLTSRLTLTTLRCFTDSQIALYWIKGTGKDWKPFIQNRVNEIRRLVPVECWGHCSGKDNPADIPSRGLSSMDLAVSKLWQYGPEVLQQDIVTPSFQKSLKHVSKNSS